MNQRADLIHWLGVSLLLIGIASSTGAAFSTEYYVAGNGDDGNPGTQALPFRTINGACRQLSDRFGGLPAGGVTIWIREGTYRETVRPPRSGTADAPIRFAAYPGEEPVVSGADVLDVPWTQHSGKIYKAATELQFEQLFVDGQMMQEARWPNTSVRELVRPTRAICDEGTNDSTLVDDDLPAGDWNGAYVHINPSPGWSYWTKRITNYKPGKSLDFTVTGWFDYRRETKPGDLYWLFGALAGLDRATEWFLDRAAGGNVVYLWCPGDPNPAAHAIEVKQRDHAFDLAGCQYINIEGLRMFAAGINMDECSYCTVVGCHLKYPMHRRIIPPPISGDLYLRNSNYISGSHNEWKDSAIAYSGCAAVDDRGAYDKITNCIIHDVDYSGMVTGGISSTHAAPADEYTYNTIYEAGAACIEIIYGGPSLRVEHNDTYNSCLLCTEYGPIWTGWTDGAETVIAYNLVHDSLDPREGEGIVLETESQNYRVHHNLIWNIPLRGIKLNSPSLNNEIYNNTILSSCGTAFHSYAVAGTVPDQRGSRIINNVANAPMDFATGLYAPEQHHNGYFAVDTSGWPTAGSLAIDAGVVIPGITDGYVGTAPDIGCFEAGAEGWLAGADWEETAFTRSNRHLEGFETGDFVEFDWRFWGDTPWLVTSQQKHSGFCGVQSGIIGNNESSALYVTLDCRPGRITFYRKVSSRADLSNLVFSIDGIKQAKWSGELDWAEVSFPVSGGRTTFMWGYAKKENASPVGQDTAWIDDIEFPIE